MDPEPDVIHKQIEETRSSLTEKLETLEAEVKDTVLSAKETVASAKEAVESTLHTAKETVQETISSVKRTFDLEYQVDRHPWGMVGLSLLSGVLAGAILGGRLRGGRRIARRMAEASVEPPVHRAAAAGSRLTHEGAERPGFMDQLSGRLGDELDKVKDLAITSLVGVVGDVAKRTIPALAHAVEDLMVRAATQAGAPPQQYGSERPDGAGERPEVPRTSGYQRPPMY
jgi:ElaB/YqjD/DUF883 family membrane-anchored ribosome-binding protein